LSVACLLFVLIGACPAAELNHYPNARLLDAPFNDGDSFLVDLGGTNVVVRLYYVDCPEKDADTDSQARRVREQARYFGLHENTDVFSFGRTAQDYTKRILTKPFTLHTAFALGGGSGKRYRYLGFVTTSGGNDLARLLVRNGLARARGTGRPTPEGVSQAETWEQLRDLESSAMLERKGLWAKSDAARLPERRSAQRKEERALRAVVADSKPSLAGKVDVNHASRDLLTHLPGVGPVMAERIIEGRPYREIGDLTRVSGIGEKTLAQLEDLLTLGPVE
jgi:DNA uptake protein ComE-like DNA-binding protein